MSSKRTAVIVGAGIGGLTAALALARTGWTVQVYEQNHKLEPVGAGLQLAPNASRILTEMGLLPRLRDFAVETEGLTVRSGKSGKVITAMEHGDVTNARWGAPFLVIHRGDLQRVLLETANVHPSISIMMGRRLEDIRFRDNQVSALFTKYNDETSVEPDIIVAADGLWSKARTSVGLPAPANFSGCVAWRTLIPRDVAPAFARVHRSNLWLGSGAHVVHYPIRGGGEINVVAIVEDSWRERGWSEPGDIAWINRRFQGWSPDLKALIESAEGWLRWSLFDRAPDWHWTRGPVTLLGDAAHPMLPFMAQGAAQAIEDAAALAKALQDDSNPVSALQTYEKVRLRRAARVQKESHRQATIYHSNGPIAMARDMALSVMGAKGLMHRYEWLYGRSV